MQSKQKPLRSRVQAARDLAGTYKKNESARKIQITDDVDMEKMKDEELKEQEQIELEQTENNASSPNEKELIVAKDNEIAQLKDQIARKIAELENFRKRTQKEKYDLIEYANEKLLFKLLDISDDFENAFSHIDKNIDENMLKGFEMIYRKLNKIFEEFNVKEIESPIGKEFDVHYHEALMAMPSAEIPEGFVVQQAQKGYLLGEKVIRHTKVITSQG